MTSCRSSRVTPSETVLEDIEDRDGGPLPVPKKQSQRSARTVPFTDRSPTALAKPVGKRKGYSFIQAVRFSTRAQGAANHRRSQTGVETNFKPPIFSIGTTWSQTQDALAHRLHESPDDNNVADDDPIDTLGMSSDGAAQEARGFKAPAAAAGQGKLGPRPVALRMLTWVVHPTSSFIRRWVFLVFVLVYYNLLLVPVRVAFDESFRSGKTSEVDGMKHTLDILEGLDWVIDVLFLFDIVVNFRTGYFEKPPGRPARLVMDVQSIRLRYLRFWFWVDLLALAPSVATKIWEGAVVVVGDDNALQVTELFRFVRVIRLLRLLKLFRGRRMLDNWTAGRVERYPLTKRLVRQFWTVWWVCHSMCCLAWWIGVLYSRLDDSGWIASRRQAGTEDLEDAYFPTQYMGAMYWTVMTLTTVGYGDVAMVTDGERLFAICCMFTGAILFAIVMSNTNELLRELNASDVQMKHRMLSINQYMLVRASFIVCFFGSDGAPASKQRIVQLGTGPALILFVLP